MFDSTKQYIASQGSVFNLAVADDYEEETLGLIISARCDIEQKKIKNGYYLSTIPFEHWVVRESPIEIRNVCEKSKKSELKTALEKVGITLKSLEIYGKEQVLEAIKNKKSQNNINDIISRIETMHGCDHRKIISENKSTFNRIITDVIENKNNDFFYIDEITGYGPCIVKLRELHPIDIRTLQKIEQGLEIKESDSYQEIRKTSSNDICSIIGVVKSPYIELIMQRFANNFVRVGVDDPSDLMIKKIIEAY